MALAALLLAFYAKVPYAALRQWKERGWGWVVTRTFVKVLPAWASDGCFQIRIYVEFVKTLSTTSNTQRSKIHYIYLLLDQYTSRAPKLSTSHMFCSYFLQNDFHLSANVFLQWFLSRRSLSLFVSFKITLRCDSAIFILSLLFLKQPIPCLVLLHSLSCFIFKYFKQEFGLYGSNRVDCFSVISVGSNTDTVVISPLIVSNSSFFFVPLTVQIRFLSCYVNIRSVLRLSCRSGYGTCFPSGAMLSYVFPSHELVFK